MLLSCRGSVCHVSLINESLDKRYMKETTKAYFHVTCFPTFSVIYAKYLSNKEYITDAYGSNFII